MADRDHSALISAGAALMGTLVGGLLAYETQHQLQNRQLARDDRRDAIVARAAARLERDRLEIVAGEVDGMLRDGHYVVIRTGLQSELSVGDRKLIAGRIDADAWHIVTEADLFLQLVAQRLEDKVDGEAIGPDTQSFLRAASRSVHRADATLEPLADGKT